MGDGLHVGLRRTSPTTRPSPPARGTTPGRSSGAGDHQLVVLDEITYPINWGWIDVDDVVATIRRPAAARQRRAAPAATRPQALIDVADTVTEMSEVKHAYKSGIRAKKGIDF